MLNRKARRVRAKKVEQGIKYFSALLEHEKKQLKQLSSLYENHGDELIRCDRGNDCVAAIYKRENITSHFFDHEYFNDCGLRTKTDLDYKGKLDSIDEPFYNIRVDFHINFLKRWVKEHRAAKDEEIWVMCSPWSEEHCDDERVDFVWGGSVEEFSLAVAGLEFDEEKDNE